MEILDGEKICKDKNNFTIKNYLILDLSDNFSDIHGAWIENKALV